jgi:hypothetical protein
MSINQQHCDTCGATNFSGDHVCRYCGAPLGYQIRKSTRRSARPTSPARYPSLKDSVWVRRLAWAFALWVVASIVSFIVYCNVPEETVPATTPGCIPASQADSSGIQGANLQPGQTECGTASVTTPAYTAAQDAFIVICFIGGFALVVVSGVIWVARTGQRQREARDFQAEYNKAAQENERRFHAEASAQIDPRTQSSLTQKAIFEELLVKYMGYPGTTGWNYEFDHNWSNGQPQLVYRYWKAPEPQPRLGEGNQPLDYLYVSALQRAAGYRR